MKERHETRVRSLGRKHPLKKEGNPLQYSCLENSTDRGTRWATVHGVTELAMTEHERTQLTIPTKEFAFHSIMLLSLSSITPSSKQSSTVPSTFGSLTEGTIQWGGSQDPLITSLRFNLFSLHSSTSLRCLSSPGFVLTQILIGWNPRSYFFHHLAIPTKRTNVFLSGASQISRIPISDPISRNDSSRRHRLAKPGSVTRLLLKPREGESVPSSPFELRDVLAARCSK